MATSVSIDRAATGYPNNVPGPQRMCWRQQECMGATPSTGPRRAKKAPHCPCVCTCVPLSRGPRETQGPRREWTLPKGNTENSHEPHPRKTSQDAPDTGHRLHSQVLVTQTQATSGAQRRPGQLDQHASPVAHGICSAPSPLCVHRHTSVCAIQVCALGSVSVLGCVWECICMCV